MLKVAHVFSYMLKEYLTINCNSKTTSEVRLLKADKPQEAPQLVMARQNGVEYFVEHGSVMSCVPLKI